MYLDSGPQRLPQGGLEATRGDLRATLGLPEGGLGILGLPGGWLGCQGGWQGWSQRLAQAAREASLRINENKRGIPDTLLAPFLQPPHYSPVTAQRPQETWPQTRYS